MSKLIKDLERIVDEDQQRLRDHLAGLAMNGELSRIAYQEYGRQYSNFGDLARKSYKIADAMLKARKELNP